MLKVATDLFHEKGINSVSVDEILEKSETGKSQFYYYFKSKEGLIEEVLNHFEEFFSSEDCPLKHDIKTWKDLDGFFQFLIDATESQDKPRACPIGFIGAELGEDQILLKKKVEALFDYTKSAFKNFFDLLKKKGELKSSTDTESLSDFCQSLIQGALMTSKIRQNASPLKNSIKEIKKYIKSFKT